MQGPTVPDNMQVIKEFDNQNYFVTESDLLVHNCNVLAGAALVAGGGMLLAGGSVAGVIIVLNTGITIAKIASVDTLAQAAEDLPFDLAMQVGLNGLGAAAKHLGTAAGRVLEFGKLTKVGRDKVLDFTKNFRQTAKSHNFDFKKINAERFKNNPLSNAVYNQKVLNQMDLKDFHGFPREVDNFAGIGTKNPLVGKDSVTRTKIELPGSYRGGEGTFEWIIEPNGLSINHRQFVERK